LETLVRVESGKRLLALGGTMPDAEAAPAPPEHLMVIAEKTINVYIIPRQEGALNYK
jgi:hypothetical protein